MAVGHAVPPLRVEVLGPLRLLVDGAPVDVPGPKRRAVLALLALAEGRIVTIDRLLDALWPAEVPESGRQALHNHVSRLRGHLGPAAARLETRHDGYALALGDDELDVAQARALLASARSASTGAFALLEEAHRLWRGPVLADLADCAPVAAAVEGYDRLRGEITDALIAEAVAAGHADGVLGLAAAAAADDPLREPSVLLHMRVLAATGQVPEALGVARAFRRRLAEETGLDPSGALDGLERDILGGTGAAPGPPETTAPPATRLIGRDAQVAALHTLLAAGRLVTIVGPGGVGKTRLAQEIARQSGAVTELRLAPVTDPAAIPHALAAALNLKVDQGDVLSACAALLADRSGLMVIDNCEHLLDGVRDTVDVILSSCPGIRLLTTSREPLGLPAEHISRLTPLTLPGRDQDPARAASVALFLDRAGRVRPGPPPTPGQLRAVADIVHRLDGMPLAIELAAGRLSTFSLEDLRDRLDRSLDLLGGGMPRADSRHRTLRATIEWSYRLLTPEEQRLFRHLSVFADGVDLDTAERVAADPASGSELDSTPGSEFEHDPGSTLARLVDASMIEVSFEGATRYRMLETLRVFGLDRLIAAGEYDTAAERMLRWAVELAVRTGTALSTEREPEADARLRRELPNLRAAWRLLRARGSLDDAATTIVSLFDAVAYRDLVELRDWAAELADDKAIKGHPLAAAVLGTAAEAAYHRGDYRKAEQLARRGIEEAAGTGGSWHSLMVLSVADLARGAYEDVIEHSLAAVDLAGPHRENYGIAALATAYGGDPATARGLNERGLAGAASPTMTAWGTYVAGEIESLAGDSEAAERHYVRAIELARTSGATFLVGVAGVGLQSVRASAGRDHEALVGYRDVIDYFVRNGNWTHLWTALRNLADLLRRLGDDEPAAQIDAAAYRAPDAPALNGPDPAAPTFSAHLRETAPATRSMGRFAAVDVARQAIERHLARPR